MKDPVTGTGEDSGEGAVAVRHGAEALADSLGSPEPDEDARAGRPGGEVGSGRFWSDAMDMRALGTQGPGLGPRGAETANAHRPSRADPVRQSGQTPAFGPVSALASLGLIWLAMVAMARLMPYHNLWFDGLVLALAIGAGVAVALRTGRREVPARRIEPPLTARPADPAWREAVARVLESVPDPVLLLSSDGRIKTANAACRHMMRAAEPGRHIASVVRTPSLLDAIEQVRHGAPAQDVDYAVHVPVEHFFHAHVVPVRLPGDEERGPDAWSVLVVVRDLTSVKRLERMRADFVASASHELRTPLASLGGFIETLRGHAKDDEQARERFLTIMGEQVARMGRLIQDLLSLSKIELNEHVPPSDQVDLGLIVRDVVDALSPLAQEDAVAIQVEIGESLPVRGERDEIVQLFQNLIDNALKYGGSGGRVDISANQVPPPDRLVSGQTNASGVMVVSIRDYGPGIPKEHIPRLTERFYRVDVRQSRRQGGTGLGLAIVKHIVNRHRGELEIVSEEGEGSTFKVYLPCVCPEAEPVDDPVQTVHLPSGLEDDPSEGIKD